MVKEILMAARDIKKGEPLMGAVTISKGYFHFFDSTGTAYRAQQARKALTPEQRHLRDLKEAKENDLKRAKKAAKVLAKAAKLRDQDAKKQTKKLMRQAKISAQIAQLQAKL